MVSGTTGWLVCTAGAPGFVTAVAAGGVTLSLSCAGLMLVCSADLTDLMRLVVATARSAVRGVRGASADVPVSDSRAVA